MIETLDKKKLEFNFNKLKKKIEDVKTDLVEMNRWIANEFEYSLANKQIKSFQWKRCTVFISFLICIIFFLQSIEFHSHWWIGEMKRLELKKIQVRVFWFSKNFLNLKHLIKFFHLIQWQVVDDLFIKCLKKNYDFASSLHFSSSKINYFSNQWYNENNILKMFLQSSYNVLRTLLIQINKF